MAQNFCRKLAFAIKFFVIIYITALVPDAPFYITKLELHDPNGKLLAAKPLFGSFQVKRTLKIETRNVKRTLKLGTEEVKRTLK